MNAVESNSEFHAKLQTVEIYKQEPYVGFGISIHTEPTAPCQANHKLVYPLVEIEEGSPAHTAGLEYGHRIVAVDGAFVNRDLRTLSDIGEAIDDSYYQNELTRLTVMDPEMWQEFLDDPKKAAALVIPNARINSASKLISRLFSRHITCTITCCSIQQLGTTSCEERRYREYAAWKERTRALSASA